MATSKMVLVAGLTAKESMLPSLVTTGWLLPSGDRRYRWELPHRVVRWKSSSPRAAVTAVAAHAAVHIFLFGPEQAQAARFGVNGINIVIFIQTVTQALRA